MQKCTDLWNATIHCRIEKYLGKFVDCISVGLEMQKGWPKFAPFSSALNQAISQLLLRFSIEIDVTTKTLASDASIGYIKKKQDILSL